MQPGRTSILSRSEPVSSSELLVILPCATPAILALIVAHTASKCNKIKGLAEREGFEPPIRFPVYTLSKRAPSATRPSLLSISFLSDFMELTRRPQPGTAFRRPAFGPFGLRAHKMPLI